MACPASTSHNRTVLSPDPDASFIPSRENATWLTELDYVALKC